MFIALMRASFFLPILFLLSCGSKEIVIGTMLAPAVGATESELSYLAAVDLAVVELNAELASQNSPYTVRLVKGDLGANADVARENFLTLINQGVNLFVGPAESRDLTALTKTADINGAILVSNASTSPTLSIAGDNTFRLVPDDTIQTLKLANRIYADGFRSLYVISRHTDYGDNFAKNLELAFEAIDDTNFVHRKIYDPSTTDFTQAVQAWLEDIQLTPVVPNTTALVLVSLEEIVPIVHEMIVQNRSTFGGFRWYSGDGVAQIGEVTDDPVVAAFLQGAGLRATSPAVAAGDQAKLDAFDARLNLSFPGEKSIYAALAYDAVTLLVRTFLDLETKGLSGVDAFKTQLPIVAAATEGITGNLALNAAGDRASLPYGLWGLQGPGPSYSWFFDGLLP